ncbi:MAG: hypothetical protein K2N23_04175 [Clostridia bacterium]|nr:hypothetical protein [Clostridia bacterium]
MKKIKKLTALAAFLLLAVLLSLMLFSGISTKAKVAKEDNAVTADGDIEPCGLYTKLTLAIDGGNGQVWATAKNKFTLFPSTVTVRVELYNSDTYHESYIDMTLVASNYISDLDQGNSISAVYSTNNKQSFWKARMYYNIDNSGWKESVTSTSLYDRYGIKV